MSGLEISEARVLCCSQCEPGTYVVRGGMGVCVECGHEVHIALDIVPHLDEGEHLVTLPGDVLAYFHAETTEPDED